MLSRYGLTDYLPSIWFKYQESQGRPRYCQTDGLLFLEDSKTLIILEAKYHHTPRAFFQLMDLYVPVVSLVFPGWDIRCLEVCRFYDPLTHFPSPVSLTKEVHLAKANEFNVHILR